MNPVDTQIVPWEPFPTGINSRLPNVVVAGAITQEDFPWDTEIIINGLSFRVNNSILRREMPNLRRNSLNGGIAPIAMAVSHQCVVALINFLQCGNIEIYDSNVDMLMKAATLLDFTSLQEQCCNLYLLLLHPESCIRIRKVALENNCEILSIIVNRFIDYYFPYLVYVKEFYLLQDVHLIDIIRSGTLNVSAEEEVLEAVLLWINVGVLDRGNRAVSLLEHVRLPTISSDYLERRVYNNRTITSDPQCRALLDRAARFHRMFGEDRGWFRGPFYTPRKSPRKSEYIIVVGGEDEVETANNAVSSIEHFDCEAKRWQLVGNSPKRIGMAVIIHRHCLWIVGGRDDLGIYNSVYLYNLLSNGWEIGPTMTTSRCDLAIALLDGMLFVVGGADGHKVLKTTECYDRPMGEQWIADAPMKFERSEFGLCAVGEGLFAVGGWGQHPNVHLQSVEHYSLKTRSWTVVSEMLHERHLFGTGVIGGLIYVVGGAIRKVKDRDIRNVAEVYNTTTGAWKEIKNTSRPRLNPGIAAVDGRLYAIGGEYGGNYYRSVECYLPEEDSWTVQEERMQRRRSGAGITKLLVHRI